MSSSPEVITARDTGREYHEAVMTTEVLEYLAVDKGIYLDLTIGSGTISELILQELKSGRLIGMDLDRDALSFSRERLRRFANMEPHMNANERESDGKEPQVNASERNRDRIEEWIPLPQVRKPVENVFGVPRDPSWQLVQANFGALERIVTEYPEVQAGVAGVVLDLGMSRHQAITAGRGFSYQADGPLDMRFDQSGQNPTAREIILRSNETEIGRIIREYGEERFWRRISRRIHEQRAQLRTTGDLAALIRATVPFRFQGKALMRVFQAFRIAVNNELENLRHGLRQAIQLLAPGGRVVVIAYHSLEDRVTKLTFREYATQGVLEILTRKPRRPDAAEVARNPSARSARLRAAEKQRAA